MSATVDPETIPSTSASSETPHQPRPDEDEKQNITRGSRDMAAAERGEQESEKATRDPNIVDWDGPDDPDNPLNWTPARKWTIISLVSVMTFNVAMASTIFAPGVPEAMKEFNSTNSAESSLLISIYLIGLAVGPLFLAPLSELYGRSIVLNVNNVVYLVATILGAKSVSLPMLLVFRLVMGLASAIPFTLGGGVVADMMVQEKRGPALTLWTTGPLMGNVVGPVAGGFIAFKLGWRWTFWIVAIIAGILLVAGLLFVKESYAPLLLGRKTQRLIKETGNNNLRSRFDKGETAGEHFRMAIIRPTKMLARSPIVSILSLYVAVVYGYMYLLFTTFTKVFEGTYGFNTGEAGLVYLGMGIGLCIGQFSAGPFTNKYLARQNKHGITTPEDRLPPLVVGSFLVPIGLFWYGWATAAHTHWIVPIIGTSLCGVGILYVFLPVQLYLVDAYTLYAASAVAACTFVRALFGTILPLAGPPLYASLGLGWGNSLLGFIAFVFAPTSVLLLRYGERIRTNPRFLPKL